MFRTAMMSFSFSGVTLLRGFVTLKAETRENSKFNSESLAKMAEMPTSPNMPKFSDEPNDFGSKLNEFMAEPLTDAAFIEANKNSMRVRMEMLLMKVQRDFCKALEKEENPNFKFQVDRWTRTEGGGGITCVLQEGHTFEKAKVHINVVSGNIPPAAVVQMNRRGKEVFDHDLSLPFFACGIREFYFGNFHLKYNFVFRGFLCSLNLNPTNI